MKKLIFTVMMLASAWCYGGGSEVPWPLSLEQTIELQNLAGIWVNKNQDGISTIYYFYLQESTPTIVQPCPYTLSLNEIDVTTAEIVRHGTSNYCLDNPRKLSFVMYDAQEQISNTLTFVGVKKSDEDSSILTGSQYIGLSVFSFGPNPERISQVLLYKLSPR